MQGNEQDYADYDPFAPENAPGLSLVVQMRIYDVLLGIYSEMAPEKAAALMDMHAGGKVIGSLPNFDLGVDNG